MILIPECDYTPKDRYYVQFILEQGVFVQREIWMSEAQGVEI